MGAQLGALLSGPKVGYQYTLAGTVLAPDVLHLKQESLKNASCKTLLSFGFMVDGWVVLRDIVSPVIWSFIPVYSELLLGFSAS